MTMDMSYLPLGKMGCGNCEDVDYYCDDCTRKISEAINKAAIYLEEYGISGDAMVERDTEEDGGSIYLHDLLADFASQHSAQANALMCGICGKKPALVCTECAKDIPRSVRLMQDVDNRAQINYHSSRIG